MNDDDADDDDDYDLYIVITGTVALLSWPLRKWSGIMSVVQALANPRYIWLSLGYRDYGW